MGDTDGVMEGPTDGDTEATGREKLMPNQMQRPHLLLMPKLSHGTTATGTEPVPTALTTGEATVTPIAPTIITDGEDTGSVRLVRSSLQADPTPMPAPRLIPKLTGMAPMAAGGEDGIRIPPLRLGLWIPRLQVVVNYPKLMFQNQPITASRTTAAVTLVA